MLAYRRPLSVGRSVRHKHPLAGICGGNQIRGYRKVVSPTNPGFAIEVLKVMSDLVAAGRTSMTHRRQFFSQICERFSSNKSENMPSAWDTALELVNDLGGSALNVVTMSSQTKQLLWARSSMERSWLDKYEASGFQMVDPFLASFRRGQSTFAIDAGSLSQSEQTETKAYALNHELAECGYGSFISGAFGDLSIGVRTMVVFASPDNLDDIYARIGKDHILLVSAFIAANIRDARPEPGSKQLIQLQNQVLSQRERDILCWLASGLRNDQIAYRANIAEITVRKHLLSIRRKLNAQTREQAIAIAVRDGWISL